MEIIVAGVSLRAAPLAAFEVLARRDSLAQLELRARAVEGAAEVLLLATCHRIELIIASRAHRGAADAKTGVLAGVVRAFVEVAASRTPSNDPGAPQAPAVLTEECVARRCGEEAFRHLVRLACGLDSPLRGEAQILGQLRAAFSDAVERKATGTILNPILHRVFRAARKIRARAGLEDRLPSWSQVLVESILSRRDGSAGSSHAPVAILGSGTMAGSLEAAFRSAGVESETIDVDSITTKLRGGGILVTASGKGRLIGPSEIGRMPSSALLPAAPSRPLDIWDLGMPRNVWASVAMCPGVTVTTLLDLEERLASATAPIAELLARAEEMIEGEVDEYRSWRRDREMAPTVVRIGRLLELLSASADGVGLSRSLRRRLVRGFASAANKADGPDEAARRLALFEEGLRLSLPPPSRSSSLAGGGAHSRGSVSLVGAGPGDAGLLTLRAAQRLREAHVVYHDALVSAEVLALCSSDARLVSVGKRRAEASLPQEEIQAALVRDARRGLNVVRLKGGDPFVFGRGGEEALALLECGVAFEIVPGVTSGIAVPALAGIPLTHRGVSSSAAFVTAHDLGEGEDGAAIRDRLNHLARGAETIVVFMAGAELARLKETLLASGLPADTPAAVIESGTLPQQTVAIGPLAELDKLGEKGSRRATAKSSPRGPVLVVIGRTVSLSKRLSVSQREISEAQAAMQEAEEAGEAGKTASIEEIVQAPHVEFTRPEEARALMRMFSR